MSPFLSLSMSMPSSRASKRNFSIINGGSNIDSSGSQLDSERLYLYLNKRKDGNATAKSKGGGKNKGNQNNVPFPLK